MKQLIIAIDGPSGAGKGTVARAVARELQYRHVDTGAMYRAVAWKAEHDGRALDDEDAVVEVARSAAMELEGRIVIDGHDVTQAIRTPEMDTAASRVARLPRVREILVARQRALGAARRIVMEGRDIGTIVFPDADVKLYLDASPAERARRRASDAAHAASQAARVDDIAVALDARDAIDRSRPVSPLVIAPDAILIDTTTMPIDAVVDQVMAIVRERLAD